MLEDKTILIEQINSFISKNNRGFPDSTNDTVVSAKSAVNGILFDELNSIKEYFPLSRILQSITLLEQRIDALEKQNEHLLYFVHFIFHNFSDLVSQSVNGTHLSSCEKNNSRHINADEYSRREKENQKDVPEITRREAEVLELLVKGLCVKEIASILFISENTVITHKKNMKEKFNARNTVELISRAFNLQNNT